MSEDKEKMKTYIKMISFCSFADPSNPTAVDVSNGKIIRTRPLHYDWKYDPKEIRSWKISRGGKTFEPGLKSLLPPFSMAYKKRTYSPNRVMYPLKRVDWNPDGDRNPQNRGNSKYERISWDEALDIVVSEIKRIKEEYAPEAIFAQGDGHGETKAVHGPHGCHFDLLRLLGGFTMQARNPDSWEGWYWGAKHAWGMVKNLGQQYTQATIPDIVENTDLLLFWSGDPESTTWGFTGQQVSRLSYWFTEVGIKQTYVCPDLNYGAAVHADRWIPLLPNTDAALHLAIAYTWITEGIYDKNYVATHTVGFDKFEEYVLGKEDGIAKTPTWAAGKTGVPSRIIKALAREWASKATTIVHGFGGGLIRGTYSHEPARLEVLLLAMQGVGKPGVHQLCIDTIGFLGIPENISLPPGEVMTIAVRAPGGAYTGIVEELVGVKETVLSEAIASRFHAATEEHPRQFIPKTLVPDAILNPPVSWYGTMAFFEDAEGQFKKFTYPGEGLPEIHMIWTDTPCWTTCWNEGNRIAEAFRSPKIEFILAQHPWLENDCMFADIILPGSTKFEEQDIGGEGWNQELSTCCYEDKCIESVGESKSDYEIVCAIADRFGLLEKYTKGLSIEERMRKGFERAGLQEKIDWEEFKEKKYYVVSADAEWMKNPPKPALRAFYEDPDKNPLETPTGKIEFESTGLKKHFPDDEERPPVPHWIPYGESHQESLQHPRAKKYPLLVVSNHPRWRVHANMDDISWFREIVTGKVRGPDGYQYEPVWINPKDASKRGIEDGDVVKVFNERGGVLGGAYLTERVIPGALHIDHGARHDPIVPGELDRGGAINVITPRKTTSRNVAGLAVNGFLVEVERVNLDELRKKYPEAFNRPYDQASGLRRERVL